jgi:hypothetical protein
VFLDKDSSMDNVQKRNIYINVGLEVLRAVTMKSSVFWDITPLLPFSLVLFSEEQEADDLHCVLISILLCRKLQSFYIGNFEVIYPNLPPEFDSESCLKMGYMQKRDLCHSCTSERLCSL